MEKGIIFGVKKFAVHDGDGIRTTLFLSGCPLRCKWCHNPEGFIKKPTLAFYSDKCVNCGKCALVCMNNAHRIENGVHIYDRSKCTLCGKCEEVCSKKALTLYGKEVTSNEAIDILSEDKEFYGDNGGATLSGGECLLQNEFCLEVCKGLRERGIGVDIDTSGYVDYGVIKEFIPYVDTFLYDIKAFNSTTHIQCTGVDNKLIKENLVKLIKEGVKVEIRIPYVPNLNDCEMQDIANFLAPLKITGIRVLPYHNYYLGKNKALGYSDCEISSMPEKEDLDKIKDIFRNRGIFVIE